MASLRRTILEKKRKREIDNGRSLGSLDSEFLSRDITLSDNIGKQYESRRIFILRKKNANLKAQKQFKICIETGGEKHLIKKVRHDLSVSTCKC